MNMISHREYILSNSTWHQKHKQRQRSTCLAQEMEVLLALCIPQILLRDASIKNSLVNPYKNKPPCTYPIHVSSAGFGFTWSTVLQCVGPRRRLIWEDTPQRTIRCIGPDPGAAILRGRSLGGAMPATRLLPVGCVGAIQGPCSDGCAGVSL